MTSVLPLVGISACLLGEAVRYDGGHKRADLLLEHLGPHVRWLPVCPEAEAGLGVPREPIRLVAGEGGVRVQGVGSGRDVTAALDRVADERLAGPEAAALAGFVLKRGSPSCGLLAVPVSDGGGRYVEPGAGRFAAALRAWRPDLPIVEEGDLATPQACAHFLARVRHHAAP